MADLRHATFQRACNCGNLPYVGCNNGGNFMPPIMPPAVFCPSNSMAGVAQYPDKESFPTTGNTGIIYIDSSDNMPYIWDGEKYAPLNGYGSGVCPDMAAAVVAYDSVYDFPDEGEEGVLYIDKEKHTIYYWDGNEYMKLSGNANSTDCNCSCDNDDATCIWGDILNGGGVEEITDSCPIPEHNHGVSGDKNCCCGESNLTPEKIIEGLGYTPASERDIKDVTDTVEEVRKIAEEAKKLAMKNADETKKQLNDVQRDIRRNTNSIADIARKVNIFESSLRNVDDELNRAQQAIEDMQKAIDSQIGPSNWELIEIRTLNNNESEIKFTNLKCRKIYASCTLCGSDTNDSHQRLEIRVNENDSKHRIATLERAIAASDRDIRYTNVYAHALNTKRVSGYIQKDADYPDSNFILQALSTRTAKNEEIEFGTEINNLYFTTGNPEGKLGRGTKIVLYGIKSRE